MVRILLKVLAGLAPRLFLVRVEEAGEVNGSERIEEVEVEEDSVDVGDEAVEELVIGLVEWTK